MLHSDRFPILEHDDDVHDLIGDADARVTRCDHFPSRAIFAFLGDTVNDYAEQHKLVEIERLETIGGSFPVYRLPLTHGDVAIMPMPLGAPAAVMWTDLDDTIRHHIVAAATDAGYQISDAPVWTNDAFFRETKQMLAYRRSQGCAIVDMECSAMAASAQFRGAAFAQLFYTADSLDAEAGHDDRGWGRNERERALQIAVDAIGRVNV